MTLSDGSACVHRAQQLETAHAGKTKIDQRDVGLDGGQFRDDPAPVGPRNRRKTFAAGKAFYERNDAWLIVDDEQHRLAVSHPS